MLGRLLKQNLLAIVSQLAPFLSGLVIMLYFPRILSKTDFGIIISLFSLTSFFANITDLGTSSAVIKIFGESLHRKDRHAGFYLRYLAKIKLIMVAITSLLILAFSAQLSQYLLHDSSYNFVIQAVGICFLSYSFIPFLNDMFAAINRYEYFSMISFLINTLKIAIPLLLLYLVGSGLVPITVGLVAAYLISIAVTLFLAYRIFKGRLSYERPKSLSVVNGFLFYSTMIMVASTLAGDIDVTILNYYRGPSEVALYNTAFAIVNTIVMMMPVSSTFLLSILNEMEALGRLDVQKIITSGVFKYGAIVSIPISFLVFFTANRIIYFLYPATYLQSADSLRILSAGIIFFFISGVCGSILTSKGKIKEVAYINVTAGAITLVSALILIPLYGYQGTALATLISSLTYAALLGYASVKMLKLRIRLSYFLKPLAVSAITSAAIVLYLNAAIKSTILLFIIAGAIYGILYLPLLDSDDKKLIKRIALAVRARLGVF